MAFPTQPPLTLSQLPSGFGVTVEVFDTPGSGNISVPPNTLAVILELWGGGGGGGGMLLTFPDPGVGGSGGSGGCVGHALFSDIPSTISYTIGGGGVGGGIDENGGSGGDTTVASLGLTAGGGLTSSGGAASGGNLFNRTGNFFIVPLPTSIAHYGETSAGAGGAGGFEFVPGEFGSGQPGEPGQIRAIFFGLGPNTLRAYKPGDGQVANHENNQNPGDPNLVTLLQFFGASRSFVTPITVEVDTFGFGPDLGGQTNRQKGYTAISAGFFSVPFGSISFTDVGKGVFVSNQATMLQILESGVLSGVNDPFASDSNFETVVSFVVDGNHTGTWWNEIGLENGKRFKRLDAMVETGSYDSNNDRTTWVWPTDTGFHLFTQTSTGSGVLVIDPDPRPSLAIDPSFDFVWSQAQGGYPFTRTYRAITTNSGFSWGTTHPNASITSGQGTDTVQITYSGDGSGTITVTTTSPSETASINVTTFTNINLFL